MSESEHPLASVTYNVYVVLDPILPTKGFAMVEEGLIPVIGVQR
jgi:hypothetical protein